MRSRPDTDRRIAHSSVSISCVDLLLHPQAEEEWRRLPTAEYRAMANALAKLRELGDQLGFPHTSNVQGAGHIRELRPRGGRSRWRAFFRRIGDRIAVGAIGPEASVDPQGFTRSVDRAEARLAALERRWKEESQ